MSQRRRKKIEKRAKKAAKRSQSKAASVDALPRFVEVFDLDLEDALLAEFDVDLDDAYIHFRQLRAQGLSGKKVWCRVVDLLLEEPIGDMASRLRLTRDLLLDVSEAALDDGLPELQADAIWALDQLGVAAADRDLHLASADQRLVELAARIWKIEP